jgi:oligopeptide/dipeptide ABC transporter ATP-binding protein
MNAQAPMMADPVASSAVLSVRDLTVEFATASGTLHVVNGVDIDLFSGETLALVGETGSGKTVTVLAATGLLFARNGRVRSGTSMYGGRDLLGMSDRERRELYGRDIAMIFQNPSSALNPVQTVGEQIMETIRRRQPRLGKAALQARAVEVLGSVGVPAPEERIHQYPHEFSGGMCQRVVIAIAIANAPKMLIADEPTTALDVTIQAQILELLREARTQTGAAMLLITHDLAVVAESADRVAVMYAGRIVEVGPVEDIYADPRHPYTEGLLACLLTLDGDIVELNPIEGAPVEIWASRPGCPFEPRCGVGRGRERCLNQTPVLRKVDDGRHAVACHYADPVPPFPSEEGA